MAGFVLAKLHPYILSLNRAKNQLTIGQAFIHANGSGARGEHKARR